MLVASLGVLRSNFAKQEEAMPVERLSAILEGPTNIHLPPANDALNKVLRGLQFTVALNDLTIQFPVTQSRKYKLHFIIKVVIHINPK